MWVILDATTLNFSFAQVESQILGFFKAIEYGTVTIQIDTLYLNSA
jgi:hypothetical protein